MKGSGDSNSTSGLVNLDCVKTAGNSLLEENVLDAFSLPFEEVPVAFFEPKNPPPLHEILTMLDLKISYLVEKKTFHLVIVVLTVKNHCFQRSLLLVSKKSLLLPSIQ